MAAPSSYTEKTLADFMQSELGKVAEVLGYVPGATDAGSYSEAVNEALLNCGAGTISEAADIVKLRAFSRVQAWRKAVSDLAALYSFSAEDGRYERQQLYAQAKQNLALSWAAALAYDPLYSVQVSRLRPLNDPYRHTPEDERTY